MIAERYFNRGSRLRFVSVVLAALALTLGFGALSTVDAQNADTWKPTTGSMSVARRHAAVTTLLDGRVLIVGGNNPAAPTTTQPLESAEIYDPATDTFAPTGSMAVGRTLHTGGWNVRGNRQHGERARLPRRDADGKRRRADRRGRADGRLAGDVQFGERHVRVCRRPRYGSDVELAHGQAARLRFHPCRRW